MLHSYSRKNETSETPLTSLFRLGSLFARSLKMPFEVYILGKNPNLNLVIF